MVTDFNTHTNYYDHNKHKRSIEWESKGYQVEVLLGTHLVRKVDSANYSSVAAALFAAFAT